MKITLSFCPRELRGLKPAPYRKGAGPAGMRAVVIDVLRACSTITHALSQGCKAIYPFESIRECLWKARELGREKIVLGGERGGLGIKGFQLGNSPLEYSREIVEGKFILFTTTNCTKNLQALIHLLRPKEVLFCSLLNLPAVAEYLATKRDGLHLALSGTEGGLSLEDAVCGGMLIHRLLKGTDFSEADLSDSARLAHATYLYYKDNLRQALFDSTHGQRLIALGMEKDLDFCAQVGLYHIIPRYSKGVMVIKL